MIVVDTNILVYSRLRGQWNDATEALFRFDPKWAAPMLWRSEFRNVLCGYMRASRLTVAEAERVTEEAASLLLGGEHLISDEVVFDLVARSKCSAYDCEFAGLAAVLGTILVTEDRALLSAFPKLCRSLEDMIRKPRS